MCLPVGGRWGVGGTIAQKFAPQSFFVVPTTRNSHAWHWRRSSVSSTKSAIWTF